MMQLMSSKNVRTLLIFVVILGATAFLYNQAYTLGGYWKPAKEGTSYIVEFTDEKGNVIRGEFKEVVRWQWAEDGKVTITKWDSKAPLTFKSPDGKKHTISNEELKKRILNLDPFFSGKIQGDVNNLIK